MKTSLYKILSDFLVGKELVYYRLRAMNKDGTHLMDYGASPRHSFSRTAYQHSIKVRSKITEVEYEDIPYEGVEWHIVTAQGDRMWIAEDDLFELAK